MIINLEREPELSLYYIGSLILDWLMKEKSMPLEQLLYRIQNTYNDKIHVDFIYYALDWLYVMSLIKMEGGKVYYENREINSTKN